MLWPRERLQAGPAFPASDTGAARAGGTVPANLALCFEESRSVRSLEDVAALESKSDVPQWF